MISCACESLGPSLFWLKFSITPVADRPLRSQPHANRRESRMMLNPLSVALNAGAKQKVNGGSKQTAVLAQAQAKFDQVNEVVSAGRSDEFVDSLLAAAGFVGLNSHQMIADGMTKIAAGCGEVEKGGHAKLSRLLVQMHPANTRSTKELPPSFPEPPPDSAVLPALLLSPMPTHPPFGVMPVAVWLIGVFFYPPWEKEPWPRQDIREYGEEYWVLQHWELSADEFEVRWILERCLPDPRRKGEIYTCRQSRRVVRGGVILSCGP